MSSLLNREILIKSVSHGKPVSSGGVDKDTCEDKHAVLREKTGGDINDELFVLKPIKGHDDLFMIRSVKCNANLSHSGYKSDDKSEFVVFDDGFGLARDENTFQLEEISDGVFAFKNVYSGNHLEVYELPDPFPTFYHSCCALTLKSTKKTKNPKFHFQIIDNKLRQPLKMEHINLLQKSTPEHHKATPTPESRMKGLKPMEIAGIVVGCFVLLLLILMLVRHFKR